MRYAVNRVAFVDAACRVNTYPPLLEAFVKNPVGGEPAWVENFYVATACCWTIRPYTVNIRMVGNHATAAWYYHNSIDPAMFPTGAYNHGVAAGVFTSVLEHGGNYRINSPADPAYYFEWIGNEDAGYMAFYEQATHPGALPEPITLTGPADGTVVGPSGATMSCGWSENAVAYEVLWGSDPRHLQVVFTAVDPPTVSTGALPPGERLYWTIQARDAFGSTYRPDPRSLVSPAGFAGDFNGDGQLDDADCTMMEGALRTSWGNPAFMLAGDFDGDGLISCADYATWLERYRAFHQNPELPDPCGMLVGDDGDSDGFPDLCDNCPGVSNASQEDVDTDGVGDVCDNCPGVFNPDQVDTDSDGLSDGCDNCPAVTNPDQTDADGDDIGDACDNCPNKSGRNQSDSDSDGIGDLCDACPYDPNNDSDGDGACEGADNCPGLSNPSQMDTDSDGAGDACDNDDDNDGLLDTVDNCPLASNVSQEDRDHDGVGDACDACPTSVPGMPMDSDGCSTQTLKGDFDHDGDVDQADFGFLQTCLSGLNVVYGSGCAPADLDADNDVDRGDVATFKQCMSGTAIPGDPVCVP